jgi:hypothetical protein
MAHRPILVRPSTPGIHKRGRRPGPTFRLPTWANFWSEAMWAIRYNPAATRARRRIKTSQGAPSQTLILIFISHPPRERAEHSGVTLPMVTDRRSGGTVMGPLGSGQCSPTAVESSCDGALSQEPEPRRQVAVLWGPIPRAWRGRIWWWRPSACKRRRQPWVFRLLQGGPTLGSKGNQPWSRPGVLRTWIRCGDEVRARHP